ncbi:F-box family protein [Rhynchospora pubera]|uniref:F-box family protein n=1 Tax=Rhynchospora pubera TaxID=906938 RepID=A0AAV8DRC0_9POAL|nr:F-box family protein [Rhynchospora pubera]
MAQSNEEIWCDALPDDVVVMILSLLPPNPFFRFKCVSKSWLALSSRALRLNKLLPPTLLGFFYETPSHSPHNIGFTIISNGVRKLDATLGLSNYDEFQIHDCCNGLVLVSSRISQPSFRSQNMYVYNLATRKRTSIELLPQEHFEDEAYDEVFSLAFDPQYELQFHVVCFRQWHKERWSCDNIFLTFSSDSGTWQRGGNLQCVSKIAHKSKGAYLDGRLHRVTEEHEIASVDPNNNTCLVTKFDFPGLSQNGISEIGQSRGVLHFMFLNESHMMSIWVLENDDRQNWILKHQLSLEEMLVNASFQNIKLHPGKDVIFARGKFGRILSIDLINGKENDASIVMLLDKKKLYTILWYDFLVCRILFLI